MAFSIVRQCVSNVKTYIAAVCFKLMDSLSFYIMETLLFFSGKKKLHSFYLFFHSRELKSVSYRYVISLISIATFKGEKIHVYSLLLQTRFAFIVLQHRNYFRDFHGGFTKVTPKHFENFNRRVFKFFDAKDSQEQGFQFQKCKYLENIHFVLRLTFYICNYNVIIYTL